ncbi:MAG: FAD-dependent oxidoreductase [Patescibacteria group bacterium]
MADAIVYDVVVVGGGAAGLTAGMFAARRGYKTIIISQDIGGQASTTPDIENYPGIDFIDGADLMKKFKAQGEKYGAEFKFDTVTTLVPKEDGTYLVKAATSEVTTQVVILAFGLSHRHLNVPGEEKLNGKGLLYCAICEPHFYRDRKVIVIGGGSSAVQAATTLSKLASDVTIIGSGERLTAEAVTVERMQAKQNITVLLNGETKEVLGDTQVTGLRVLKKDTQETVDLNADVVFVEIGYMAKAGWVKELLETDARGQIKIGPNCDTSRPGIFAAGDVTTITFKQVVISAGEGAKAALEADQYLLAKSGKRGGRIDWGTKK